MLPIATVQGVRDGISTGMIIDLSEYLKKTEGVSKEEMQSLESVVANKLDIEPQHKHHLEDIKQLQSSLDSKYDKGEKYSYNVILSDSEKIPYLENPKITLMELVQNKEMSGYKFYVDESNGDLMIILNEILIGHYSKSGNKWVFNGITETLQNSMNNYATKDHVHEDYASVSHVHEDYATKYMLDEQTLIEKVNIVNPDDFVLEATIPGDGGWGRNVEIESNYSLLNTKIEVICNVSGIKTTRVITIGATETNVAIDDNSIIESMTYNDSAKLLNIRATVLNFTDPEKTSAKVIESTHTETQVTNIKTKINEIETILKNHYDALMLLLEKHDMVDSNTGDGSNVTPQ